MFINAHCKRKCSVVGAGADSKSNAKEASPSSKRPAKRKPDMAAASKFSTAATPAKSAKAAKSSQVNGDKEAVAQVQNEDQEAQVDKDWSQFYLMKNEPDDFSVDDLACEPDQTTCWGAAAAASAALRTEFLALNVTPSSSLHCSWLYEGSAAESVWCSIVQTHVLSNAVISQTCRPQPRTLQYIEH